MELIALNSKFPNEICSEFYVMGIMSLKFSVYNFRKM